MRAAKIVAIVIGALLIIIGLALVVPGSLLLWIDGAHQDNNGFLTTPDWRLSSSGYALTTPDVKLNIGSGDWLPGGGLVQMQATSDGGAPLFLGIGRTADVQEYLSGVAYDEVTNVGWFSSSAEYLHYEGGAPSSPPGQQTFWVAQQEGQGTQTLQWDVRGGDWTAVVMNGDATAPVEASVSLGARLGFLFPLGIGMTVAGVVLLAVGITLVVLGARRRREPPQPGYPAGQAPYGPGQQPPGQPPQYAPYPMPPYQQPPAQQPYTQPPQGAYAPPPYQAQPQASAPYAQPVPPPAPAAPASEAPAPETPAPEAPPAPAAAADAPPSAPEDQR